jgi:hypothetical protein
MTADKINNNADGFKDVSLDLECLFDASHNGRNQWES